MNMMRVSSAVLLLAMVVLYQNCGQTPQASNPNDEIVHKLGDSSSVTTTRQFNIRWWANGTSSIDHRSPEDSNAVDFFNISPGLQNVLSPDQKFIVLTTNGRLSPNVILQFNGETILAAEYQNLVDKYLKGGGGLAPYQLAGPTALSNLKLIVPKLFSTFNIRSSREELVRVGEFNSNQEYCDGALIVQIADPDTLVIDPQTGIPSAGILFELAAYAVSPQDL